MQYDNFCYSSCIAPFPLFISHVNILFFFLLILWLRGSGWGHSRVVNIYQILVLNWKRALMMADTISMPDIVAGGNPLVGVWNVGLQYAKSTYCTCESNQHLQQGLTGENAISFWFFPHFYGNTQQVRPLNTSLFWISCTNTHTHLNNRRSPCISGMLLISTSRVWIMSLLWCATLLCVHLCCSWLTLMNTEWTVNVTVSCELSHCHQQY